MTCFSIQKSLIFSILAAFLMALPLTAQAQNDDFLAKTKAAEEKMRLERAQEEKMANSGHVDSPIVLELFTTSDCTSCVYADRMLYDSMKDKNVIALSCHIKDMSELKKKSEKEGVGDNSTYDGPMDPCVFRLWTYNSQRISQEITIAIPTFIFNGYDQLGAGDMTYFATMLNTYHYAYKNKALEVFMQWKDDDTITVNLPQSPLADRDSINASVWLIRYKDMAVERIDTGVNKGRVLRFSNIIQDIRHVARWHGQVHQIDIDVPKPEGGKERGGYVIEVAPMMGDPVLAAGKLEDYPTQADRKKVIDEAKAKKEHEEKQSAERVAAPAPDGSKPAAAAPAAPAAQAPAAPATAPAAKPATSYITP